MSDLRLLRSGALALTIAAIYFAAGKIGLSLAFINASASAVWPPTGIALASLLIFGNRVWPGKLIGANLVNVTTAGTVGTSIGIALGNTAEGLLGAMLVRRLVGGPNAFGKPSHVFRFSGIAGTLSTALSASIGVATLAAAGFVGRASLGPTWFTWWLGDLSGALVVAPVLILWWFPPPFKWTRGRVQEVVLLLISAVTVGAAVFLDVLPTPGPPHFPQYLCVPVLLWAAYRFTAREAASVVALLSGIAIVCTLRRTGPFAAPDANASLLVLQGFMAVWSVATLALAAAVSDQRMRAARVQLLNSELEERVVERTKRLEETNQELRQQADERWRAEEQLRQSELRLREAQHVAQIGSWEWDIERDVVWWSEALYSIYGLDPQSFGASYSSFLCCVHPEDRDRVNAAIEAASRDQRSFTFDHRIVRPDGKIRTVNARGHVVADVAGKSVRMIGTGQDITERELVEEERAKWIQEQAARREAVQANQLKDEFLAMLSHELRNPLNAIVVWAHMLREGSLDEAGSARAVEAIDRNAKVQNKLILDLLDLSRLNSGKLELRRRPISPVKVIEDALETMKPLAEAKGVRVWTSMDEGTRQVMGDAERLQQVVWNLLSNAIHFTPEGGRVGVALESRNGSVEIRVEDEGPGIQPDILPVVFDAVRRGDVSQPGRSAGLGLGLAIVRRLAELHSGTVRAENRRDGTGAVFTVSLPCLAPVDGIAESAARAASRTGSAAPPALPLRGIRILVVEDDFDSADGLATLLARRGAEVAVADSFAGALEHLDRGLPDVLVSDIALPDGDGYELLARVRAMSGNRSTPVPAIALTAYAGVEHSRKATSVGYEVHFAKPFDTDDLIAVIARLAVHTRASS